MMDLEVLESYKHSLAKAEDFDGPFGTDIVHIPVRTRGQFEYCRKHKIEVFHRKIKIGDYQRTLYFVPVTFTQALFGIR